MILDMSKGKGEGNGKGSEWAEASDEIERACPNGAATGVASVPRSADEKEGGAGSNELTKESDEKVEEENVSAAIKGSKLLGRS